MNKTLLAPLLAAMAVMASPAQAQVFPCRDFTTTVLIGGVPQPAWGRSCLQHDGSWQLVPGPVPVGGTVMGYDPAYLPEEQIYVVQQHPRVVRHHYVERPRLRPSVSLGYSTGRFGGHRHHGWGTGVGVGFGPYW